MTIVDAEGRLFGRWNFIDVLVGVLVLAIGPLGYAGFLLFRSPDPKITAIQPAEVLEGPNQRVVVRGENLRPYLRVSFDNAQGRTFLFQDSTKAEVDLNVMPPGTYDVVLYDFGQERHRLPKAFTVKPNASLSPTQEVVAVGRFIGLAPEDTKLVRVGMALPFPGNVTDVAPPRPSIPRIYFGGLALETPNPTKLEVPAVLSLTCSIIVTGGQPECGRQDFTLRALHVLAIPTSGASGISFQIDQIRSIEPVREIRVRARLLGTPEALGMVAAGDIEFESRWNAFALGSRIESIEPARPGVQERLATLMVRAQQQPTGWWNGVTAVRVGGQFQFVSDRYSLTAMVQSINAP